MYANANSKSSGPLSVAVPGELAGLYKAWSLHGKLPWPRLIAPAINLAQNGFRVSPYLRLQLEATAKGVLTDQGLRTIFTTANGTLLKVGDICYNKRLAKTLKGIAEHGPSVFYNGPIGAALVRDVKRRGGILSTEDLRRYKVKVTRPLSADIIGHKFLTMPPPSAGGAGLILVS
jgi:gamma-glutamyltranspeptidase / glutathione hydrolase / leukotriene-C4 hydrolase